MCSLIRALLFCSAVGVLGGCVIGAPPGFAKGDNWAFPLINPLEEGVLLAPVFINDTGPYLFIVDPDAPMVSIDESIAAKLDLIGGYVSVEQLDEDDKGVQVRRVEVAKISVGTLTVTNRSVRVHRRGSFWANGRYAHGVLGRTVIADSLLFAIDRDRGMAYLATAGNMLPPAGATAVKYRDFACQQCSRNAIRRHDSISSSGPGDTVAAGIETHRVVRRVAQVTINQQHEVDVHLDLGGPLSMLWPRKLQEFALPQRDVKTVLFDEFGTRRNVSDGTIAAQVTLGGLQANGLTMVPYRDKRFREVELDGTLGQNFFADYHVTVDWHKSTFWLKKRSPAGLHAMTRERIGRWTIPAFDSCQNPACVTIEVAAQGQAAAPVGYSLHISREPQAVDKTYEIMFEALDAQGNAMTLPRLIATLPGGTATLIDPGFDSRYSRAASFRVLDMNAHPRECQRLQDGQARCVWGAPVRL